MKLLTLDLETYFDSDYSLSKMSTEAYCRDSRFKIHTVGYFDPATMQAPANCLPLLLPQLDIPNAAVLCHHAQFDLLALNHWHGIRPKFIFDTLSMARLVLPRLKSHSLDALAQHFGLPSKNVPYNLFKGVRDLDRAGVTQSISIYGEVAEGCEFDCFLTYQIFKKLLPLVPRDELQVIDTTIRMFSEPCLRLDRPRMEAFLQAERLRKARAMVEAGRSIGMVDPVSVEGMRTYLEQVELGLQSSDKFRIALESLGYACPLKWSEKQQIEIPALAKNDDGMRFLEEHHDSRVQALAAARLGVKSTIDETRATRLLDSSSRGSLPVYLAYAAAKTLRFGGGDKTNWQNFRRGGEIRQSVLAPEGHKLVIGDLSQIEYRMLLWLTGQWDKLNDLAAGIDLYCGFASEFYGEVIVKDDKPRRGVGKQGILMGGYGAGKGTMVRTAAGGGYGPPVYLSDAEGQRMVDLYRLGHPCVTEFWKWCDRAIPILASGGETAYHGGQRTNVRNSRDVLVIRNHKIYLPNGTWLDFTGLKWACNTDIFPDQQQDGQGYSWWEPSRKGWHRIWGSKLTADIIQALAGAIIKTVMAIVSKRLRVVLQVHDELCCVVPSDIAEQALEWLLDVLRTPPAWCPDIPLEAEGLVSERYEK